MNDLITTYVPLISTVVVCIATVVLVWLTSKYVRLTKHMADEMTRSREPAINVDFEYPKLIYLTLVISNAGQSAAKDVRFHVEKDLACLHGQKDGEGISSLNPIRNGISYLTPGRKLKYHAGFLAIPEESSEATLLRIRVSFKNETGSRTYTQDIDIDLSHLRGIHPDSFDDPTKAVAKAIRDAERNKHTSSVASMFLRRQKKGCPVCGERIPQEAKKCPQCGEWIEDKEAQEDGQLSSEAAPSAPPEEVSS
jgi:hypothetical protein